MPQDQAYQEAAQRIEKARLERAKELYLSGMQLTAIPDAIASLTQLEWLYLDNNQVTAIPDAIASLTQLQGLFLNNNRYKFAALQFAVAEELFYQLIVRLHKYSLGRNNYENSIHWQRGLMLDIGVNLTQNP